MDTQTAPVVARFGARPRRGILLGLSGPRLGVIASAAMLLTLAMFTAGFRGAILASPVGGLLVASAFVPIASRTAIEWLPVGGHWALRRALGQNMYGVRPLAPRPAGTLALPGDAAALRVYVDKITRAAMLHDPHRRTLTVTCLLTHPAFVLLGTEDQNRQVTGWGRVLASLARTGHIAAVQVQETSTPDQGNGVLDWWTNHGHHDQSWASRTYDQFVAAAAPSAARHRTTLTLSLDLKRASRAIHRAGRGLAAAVSVLRSDMAALVTALTAAEIGIGQWLGEADIAAIIRSAYDPDGAAALETARAKAALRTAGPVGVREHWGWLESDRSASAVLWISEWPRAQAYANFLHPLLLAPDVRKTFSLVARPIPTADARKEIRRQKVNYVTDAEQKARIGQIADLTDTTEFQDVLAREADLAHGHADLRFAGLIAVSAADKDSLDAAVGQIEQAAIQCDCETRLLVGQQSQAFAAAALPLARGL